MDQSPGGPFEPGDTVHYRLDSGATVPATVLARRDGGWVIRIEPGHLRLPDGVVTFATPDRLH